MTAEARVQDAIQAALPRTGDVVTGREVFHVIEAGLVALAREVDSALERRAPATDRRLPTSPGSVVLVTEVRGEPVAPPQLGFRDSDPDDCYPWRLAVGVRDGGGQSGRMLDSADITGWQPMRVVRDDERGPVAALVEIDRLLKLKPLTTQECEQAIAFAVREALAALPGTPS